VRLWSNVFRPRVADEADLHRYVVSVNLFAWTVAISADVIQWTTSFVSWAFCAGHAALTTAVVLVVAVPVARTMGRAHLELHRTRGLAERLSRTDPLTGLANRRAFYEAASRLGDGVLALVIADIDRFKGINDRYGHAAGDEIIKRVATRMSEDLGDLGVVARLGGEEFALIGADLARTDIYARLQTFRRRLAEETAIVDGAAVTATVSIGFATRAGLGFDALYAAADKALYVAKSAGRNRVVDFDEIVDIAPPAALRTG
jgi:diguanylate cyclase (GGDEF)-like protein